MAQVQVLVGKTRTDRRDNELRRAHQEAFGKIRAAKDSPGYHKKVTEAVQELIDACEAYINR